MFPVTVLCWLSLAALASAPLASNVADVSVDAEVLEAVNSGRARVLLELHLEDEFKFEGELTDQGVQDQRAAIAAVQDSILSELGKEARVMRRPETVPLLALEIGADSLAVLRTMPDRVIRILRDDTATAQRPRQ